MLSSISSESQVLADLLLLIVSMIIHVKIKPYADQQHNTMELYSIQVISLTMYAGMFYATGSHYSYMKGNSVQWFFYLLIIIPNLAFIAHWLNCMRIELLKITCVNNKRMFKIISVGLIDIKKYRANLEVSKSTAAADIIVPDSSESKVKQDNASSINSS